MKKPTYKELERKVQELEAQSATTCRTVLRDLPKAGDCLMTSLEFNVIVRNCHECPHLEFDETFGYECGITDKYVTYHENAEALTESCPKIQPQPKEVPDGLT